MRSASQTSRFALLMWVVSIAWVMATTLAFAQTEISIAIVQGPGAEPAKAVLAAAEAFNQSQSDIRVTVEYAWDLNKILVATAGNSAPDIVTYHNGPTLAASGAVVPLDDLIARDGFSLDVFFDPLLYRMSYQGKVHVLPLYVVPSFPVLYSRQAFFESGLDPEAPPATIDEYDAFFPKLTRRTSDGNISRIANVPWSGLGLYTNTVQVWTLGRGGQLWDIETDRPTFDSEAVVETMNWLKGYHDQFAHLVGEGGAGVNWKRLVDGLEAYTFDVGTMIPNIRNQYPEFDLGITAFPSSEAADMQTPAVLGAVVAGISPNSRNRDAAWEFMRFIAASSEGTTALATGGGQFPAMKGAPAYEDIFLRDPDYREIINIIATTKAAYFVSDSVHAAMATTPIEAAIPRILRENLDPQTTLEEVQRVVLAGILEAEGN